MNPVPWSKNLRDGFDPDMKSFTATVLILLSLGILFPYGSAYCQDSNLGMFEKRGDIGAVLKPGSATYNSKKQEYVIEGSGTNMWGGQDEFHFVWKRMKGNFILTTKAQLEGRGVEG